MTSHTHTAPDGGREETFLVAVTVTNADTRRDAELDLHEALKTIIHTRGITEWWIAEDDRLDGSDNDSAVFVPYGEQDTDVWHLAESAARDLVAFHDDDALDVTQWPNGMALLEACGEAVDTPTGAVAE